MNYFSKIKKLINNKKAKICVIGLGYVGLPIVLEFARKGYFVYGYDSNSHRVEDLLKGESYITDIASTKIKNIIKNKKFLPTLDDKVLSDADIIIICVPTPLRKTKIPNISYIIKASRTISKHIRPGQLIILESTSYPGTTKDVVLPILGKKNLKQDKEFFLAFSPERIDPGNKDYTFPKIPKIVGGITEKSTILTKNLYLKVVNSVICVKNSETAEVVKLLENTYRIINIGLINEFAVLCNKLKINTWEVVNAAKSKPFGFMPFYPGPGLGGHCIPADPLYLSWKAKKVGFKTKMIDLASKINLFMPHYAAARIQKLLASRGKPLKQAKILILGVTYKKNVKDLRESPALDLIEILKNKRAKVSYSDPYIPYIKIAAINLKSAEINSKSLKNKDLVVLVADHDLFNYRMIEKNSKLIFDTRNIFDKLNIKSNKIVIL